MECDRRAVLGAGVALAPAAAADEVAGGAMRAPVRGRNGEIDWEAVRALYDVPDDVIQLENGNYGVMARPVLAAYEAATRRVNRDSSFYTRRGYGADLERVRARVATAVGAAPEEIAFTRGATEALQMLIGGYHRLGPGDQVLYADADYPAMQSAIRWLAERRGVTVVRIELPEPAESAALIEAYRAAVAAHPRLKLALLTHVGHLSGVVLPVKEIASLLREAGVDCILDSAHAFGQLDVRIPDLGVDFVGFNLHKWFGAPIGVGAFYIRGARLDAIEPFMDEREVPEDDIRARVHTGTANFAAFLAVEAALDLHEGIGVAAKQARLRHLRSLWTESLRGRADVEILTPAEPAFTCALSSFRIAGRTSPADNAAVARALLERFGIFTVSRVGLARGACVRVTPGLFTREDEVRRLAEAVAAIARI